MLALWALTDAYQEGLVLYVPQCRGTGRYQGEAHIPPVSISTHRQENSMRPDQLVTYRQRAKVYASAASDVEALCAEVERLDPEARTGGTTLIDNNLLLRMAAVITSLDSRLSLLRHRGGWGDKEWDSVLGEHALWQLDAVIGAARSVEREVAPLLLAAGYDAHAIARAMDGISP